MHVLFFFYQEFYMSGCHAHAKTEVEIMWTNQHGTGPKTNDRVETQVILQYMCQAYPDEMFTDVNKELDVNDYEYHTIRNGQSASTQSSGYGNPESNYISKELGLHEPYHYYEAYYRRERNKGEISLTRYIKDTRDFSQTDVTKLICFML